MSGAMATLGDLGALLPNARCVGEPSTPIARVHSDTRTLQPGDLFVALRGERFDAHDFLAQARAAGAVAALAERGLAAAGLAGLEVADSRRALGELAAAWRARFTALPLVAITGSNGKTTVTQMVASMLRVWLGDAALATAGNFNNDIGVPLTLLRLRAAHRSAVVELGMNHPGEIAQLARLAAPTVALVNNAQREHQEFMAGIEAVARENGAAIEALGPQGVAVFPHDDEHTALWRALAGARAAWSFALDDERATVNASAAWQGDAWQLDLRTPAGAARATLRVAGVHNAKNALAALACALVAGCPLDAALRGLAAFEPVKGRSQARPLRWKGADATLIDDSYNANPDSMRAAIDVLGALPAPRWLLIGDMGEVGEQGAAFHAEIGAHARSAGIETLWAAGAASLTAAQAYGGAARHFASTAALVEALNDEPDARLPEARAVLVKGSRFMAMEKAVAALQARGAAAKTPGAAC
ncbi:MAG TPA: UDP-N-acetylmuramoyl-tripeptide--D-alanyl-D-alanine ligase [Methylibium sp.]|uniref:UDP-N-acetylmuramoyl-tripeptide--D-alanyl-D- alanine ligase n=1 Tax=Methylibium sp. TaxID=2067992 RepID=UPI002DBF7372|nr:UDP-N-acetylmuramoyl-tripeptide--D-alanyl-D-alanine ligase [Methylibium sp.]HEU4460588.1 UDP-N-acetylmuramoyl-tripeptide--D-alanyl-D-alanine ligase [Methylibium sp.]